MRKLAARQRVGDDDVKNGFCHDASDNNYYEACSMNKHVCNKNNDVRTRCKLCTETKRELKEVQPKKRIFCTTVFGGRMSKVSDRFHA